MMSGNFIIVTLRHGVPLHGSTHRLIFAWNGGKFILRCCRHSAEVIHIMIH